MADAEYAERGALSLYGENERDRYDVGREKTHGVAGTRREVCGPCNGFWSDAIWTPCRDGKMRPIEPGTFPLAHGAPARVGRLRMYGDCIVAPQAEAFIGAYMEVMA